LIDGMIHSPSSSFRDKFYEEYFILEDHSSWLRIQWQI